MKKRFCLKTVALATVLILTGCIGSENMDSSVISVTTTPYILSETELVTEAEISQTFTNALLEDTDTTSAVTYILPEDTDFKVGDTIVGMDGVLINVTTEEKNDYYATFDTFTFYRESTGMVFNDDSYRDYRCEWKKTVLGDVFGPLVVSSVYSEYKPIARQYENALYFNNPDYEAVWSERNIIFDGTIILNGILYADASETAFWGKCLFFQPTAKSLADNSFPTLRPISLCLSSDPYEGESHEDSQTFFLGNIDDFKDIIDWSEYTDENNMIKVYAEIELSDIELSYNTGTGASNHGEANMTKIIRICHDEN